MHEIVSVLMFKEVIHSIDIEPVWYRIYNEQGPVHSKLFVYSDDKTLGEIGYLDTIMTGNLPLTNLQVAFLQI